MRNCIICEGKSTPYFEKDFHGSLGLRMVQYAQCTSCGFVFSDTHYAMSDPQWSELNEKYHLMYFGKEENPDDSRWLERLTSQTEAISLLAEKGAFDTSLPALDYACGDGKLCDLLCLKAELRVCKYDKYLFNSNSNGYLNDQDIKPGKFGLVISTSVFEHIRDLATLDEIATTVHVERGVFALHTLVREEIPADPNWFYLLPVHVSFFSNRSMAILFQRWRFAASIYDIEARMWFMFQSEDAAHGLYDAIRDLRNGVVFKSGFVNYWK